MTPGDELAASRSTGSPRDGTGQHTSIEVTALAIPYTWEKLSPPSRQARLNRQHSRLSVTLTGAWRTVEQPHLRLLRQSGLFNALFLDWVSPKCHTLTQTAIG
jgi:hypothetical protein